MPDPEPFRANPDVLARIKAEHVEIERLAQELRAAGYVTHRKPNQHGDIFISHGAYGVEIAVCKDGFWSGAWSQNHLPAIRIIDRYLVAAGIAPAPESDDDPAIPFVPQSEYETDAIDEGTQATVFALGYDFDDEEGAGDA